MCTCGERTITLEVCVDSLDTAIIALNHGASRLEVCADLHVGGTSPSEDLVAAIHQQKAQLNKDHVPCYAMVRPRDGDFFYTDEEFERMKKEIESHGSNDAIEGVVFGILTSTLRVDIQQSIALALKHCVIWLRTLGWMSHSTEHLISLVRNL